MKILFIGGTGTISTAVSRKILAEGHELYLLNRGNRNEILPEAKWLKADINDEKHVAELIKELDFDVVADFIAFTPDHVERDFRLFNGKTQQYIFISSASAYQKPPAQYIITENTPLQNPFWQYSRNKIACEEYLRQVYRENAFPITIVRPSHTYDERAVPLGVHGEKGSWQVIERMLKGKPVIIHGDGSSLWTMTHARDFAGGFFGLLGNPAAIGESVHITSDESLTWNQIYKHIANALGVELYAVHTSSDFLSEGCYFDIRSGLIGDKSNSVVFDNSKIKRLVPDFAATTAFANGVQETVDYVLAHPELQTPDKYFDFWCDKMLEARHASVIFVGY
ncbi:MAG: SDR family oxidoreductase [Prevotellaceae bacterium]|jgi:nucleoside-diphosphate-sugar epimerase|nr:SDR family oxidoreductase [Prevotellaceae bacterium]